MRIRGRAAVVLASAGLAACLRGEASASVQTSGQVLALQVQTSPVLGAVGQFNVGTTAGNSLLFDFPGEPWSSFGTVTVDGTEHRFGDLAAGSIVGAPAAQGPGIATTWQVGQVRVEQKLKLTPVNVSGGSLYEMLRIEYKATNLDSASHQVGFRVLLDLGVGAESNGWVSLDGGSSVLLYEQLFSGTQVPAEYRVLDQFPGHTIQAVGVLSGPGATTPDAFAVGSLKPYPGSEGLISSSGIYSPGMNRPIHNSACAIYWSQVTVPAGQSRSVVTYYGGLPFANASPTISFTHSPTSTPSGTDTFTRTASPTTTAVFSATATPTRTPSGTFTVTATPTHTPKPTAVAGDMWVDRQGTQNDAGLLPPGSRFNQLSAMAPPLPLAWSFTNWASSAIRFSSPAYANGLVYTGSVSTGILAWNAGTGALLWSFALPGGSACSPAVWQGRVYGFASGNGGFYGLNAATGAFLWSHVTGFNGTGANPVVGDGVLYSPVATNDTLYALNAVTGAMQWSYVTAGAAGESAPALSDGGSGGGTPLRVHLADTTGKVYAIQTTGAPGSLAWSYQAGSGFVGASPLSYQGRLYAADGGGVVHALNASTGGLAWSASVGGSVLGSGLAGAYGKVYATTATNFRSVALDAATGAHVWSYALPYAVLSTAAAASGHVYYGDTANNLYAKNAFDGSLVWSFALPINDTGGQGVGRCSPAVAGQLLFVTSETGNGIFVFDPSCTPQPSQTCTPSASATATATPTFIARPAVTGTPDASGDERGLASARRRVP